MKNSIWIASSEAKLSKASRCLASSLPSSFYLRFHCSRSRQHFHSIRHPFYYVMHKIWANQHVQFYEAIFEPPQALLSLERLMKNSIPQVRLSELRHCSNLYEHVIAVIYTWYVKKTSLWFIRIQVNQHNYKSFKRITLSFVYFWQVIFFWAVMLHITKSNIKNVSQILSKARQKFWKNSIHSFVKTVAKLTKLLNCKFSYFQQCFHILLVHQINVSNKLGNSRKLGIRGRIKLQIRGAFITQSNIYDGEFSRK